MNRERRDEWVAALRSGEYEQGTGALHLDGRFCCLGVACDLAVKAGVIPAPREYVTRGYGYGPGAEENSHVLPRSVAEWLGLPVDGGRFDWAAVPTSVAEDGERKPLTYLNDNGWTFGDIADLIEREF